MTDCPSPHDIAALVLGSAPASQLHAMAEHLASCAACRAERERLLASLRGDPARASAVHPAGRDPSALRHALAVARDLGYEALGVLGAGRQGVVVAARDETTGERVALKVPGARATEDAPREREAELSARLDHPGVVVARREGGEAGVMPLVEGVRLDEALASRRSSPREIVALVAEICDAVEHLHARGVLHRDLKPANVLVDASGRPRVLDLGLAVPLGAGAFSERDAGLIGTLGYASPEQLAGDARQLDARTDVFALGVMLYEGLTGVLPRRVPAELSREALGRAEAVPPSLLGVALDPELERIVLTALATDAGRRHASVAALRAELLDWLARGR